MNLTFCSITITTGLAVYFISLLLLLVIRSRNVAFKVATMRDSIMAGQRECIMRKTDSDGVGPEDDNDDKDVLEDLAYNADLFIANPKNNALEYIYVYFSASSIVW